MLRGKPNRGLQLSLLDFRLAGDHLYGKLLFTWLSLVMSMMVSLCVVLFFRDVFCEILNLIEFLRGFQPTLASSSIASGLWLYEGTNLNLEHDSNTEGLRLTPVSGRIGSSPP